MSLFLGFLEKAKKKSSHPALQSKAGWLQTMLQSSVSLQTAVYSLGVSLPLLLAQLWGALLDFWATAVALSEQSNL
jgi:hypothetical protein